MKTLCCALLMTWILVACKSPVPEDNFVGHWEQINGTELTQLTADISKEGYQYKIEIRMPKQTQVPPQITMARKLTDEIIEAEGIEKINFQKATGHIHIGANEFALVR